MKNMTAGVKRVILLKKNDLGSLAGTVVYEARQKKKKVSEPYRGVEKLMTRVAREQANVAVVYLDRHRRSNEKKKDGWVKDIAKNMRTAFTKARKSKGRLIRPDDLRDDQQKATSSVPVYRVNI